MLTLACPKWTALLCASALVVLVLGPANAEALRPFQVPLEELSGKSAHAEEYLTGQGLGLDLNRNLRMDPANGTDLDKYMALADPVYEWEFNSSNVIEGSIPLLGKWKGYLVNMTSLTWLTPEDTGECWTWHNGVLVVVPESLDTSIDTMMIWPSDGLDPVRVPSWKPDDRDKNTMLVSTIALMTRQVVVGLFQIPNAHCTFPNDPKHESRTEDSLMAFTWRQFLDAHTSGDPNGTAFQWPAQCPMVKATVRAMDATQEFLSKCESCGVKNVPDHWVVFGASKRGWVTWLTAAVDKRVVGIIPVVFDLLNTDKLMHQWWQNYGAWSFALEDYFNENIMGFMDTPAWDAFNAFLDPLMYKDRLTMPKYIVTSGNDEFFQTMDDHAWWDQMPGKNLLLKTPNADHVQVTGLTKIIPSIATWMNVINEDRKNNNPASTLPTISWDISYEGSNTEQVGIITARVNLASPGTTAPNKALMRYAYTLPGTNRIDFRFFTVNENCPIPQISFPAIYSGELCPNFDTIWNEVELPAVNQEDLLVYTAKMKAPESGWMAMYIQFEFPGKRELIFLDYPFYANTQAALVPNDVLPFPPCHGSECSGSLV